MDWPHRGRVDKHTTPSVARRATGASPRAPRSRTRSWRAPEGLVLGTAPGGSPQMSTWGMPRRPRPRKDAPTRRNALGKRWELVIQRSPNGATRRGSYHDTVARQGVPGELKHLSTPRSREDARSSGERTGRSPNRPGGTGCRRCPTGVGRLGGTGRQARRARVAGQPKAAGTGHRRG